jgi:hypothetical protein
VLNFCASITITWTGRVDDEQCVDVNHVFHRQLAAGNPVGTCFDFAKITVARWTELIPPPPRHRYLRDR